ncbi:hypothetical protein CEQ90_16010 [Lewinellaceae bacterium SD302]|nr:hypothetical protein CEQ90_16010 [Lewinellaceae bacterium SD302]
MQKRIYWMLGAALVLIAAIFILDKTDGNSAQGTRIVDERDFKIEDTDRIGKIFLADRKGYTTILERQENGDWELDGQYKAYDNAMKNLLDAVSRIDLQFIPAAKAVPAIVGNLASEGIHVELFDLKGEKIKGYYIGGSTNDERGTYAIMEDAEQPYVVHLPGWTGNLRFRYSLIEQEWRDRQLFGTDLADIQLASIEYPTRRNRSFVLERNGEEWTVGPYYETSQPVREVPRGRAEYFLVNFEESYLVSYANYSLEEKTDLIQRIPYAIIRLARKDGSEKVVKIFPRLDESIKSLDPNTDAFASALGERGFNLLFNDDKDFATAATDQIVPFLRSYDNF